MMQASIISADDTLSAQHWDAYIHEQNIPGLALWAWGDVLENFYKKTVIRILVRDGENHVQGYFLGYHAPYKGPALYGTHFGFHAKNTKAAASITEAIEEYCQTCNIARTLLSCGTSLFDADLQVSEKTNMFLPLKEDEDTLWSTVPKKTRNMVRKAEKQNYSVSRDWKHLDDFYAIYENRFYQKGLTMKPKGLFEYEHTVFGEDLVLFTALNENAQVEAGMLFFQSNKIASYLYNASNDTGSSNGANNLIMWEAMKFFAARGVEYIELGEATKGGAVYNFKKRLSKDIEPVSIYYTDILKHKTTAKASLNVADRLLGIALKFYKFWCLPSVQIFLLKRGGQSGRVM